MSWCVVIVVAWLSLSSLTSAVVTAVRYCVYPVNCLKVLVVTVKDCVVSNIDHFGTTIPLTDRSIDGGAHGATPVATP